MPIKINASLIKGGGSPWAKRRDWRSKINPAVIFICRVNYRKFFEYHRADYSESSALISPRFRLR